MTERPDITALLERAVSDVRPASRRPTDDVLARAGSSRLATLRKLLAGLVGAALIGGGAVVVATGSDDRDVAPQPEPVRLVVDPPAGWSVVDGQEIRCGTPLTPRTVYRDAVIADLSSCVDGGPRVTGPTLLVGRLDAGAAEQVRAAGTPVTAAGIPGYVTGYDNLAATAVWLPAGDLGDLAYVALGPAGPDDPQVAPDFVGAGRWTLPQEALDAAAAVRVRGYLPRLPVLPERVSAVDLRPEWVNIDPEPGARVDDPAAVAALLAALRPAEGEPACGPTVSLRTLHLQDAASGRWSRVDVLEDGAGCRTAVSELGASARIAGDPVAVAVDAGRVASAQVAPDAQRVSAHGLSIPVPTGWAVVRGDAVDPCRLRKPSVVVSDTMSPSCTNPGLSRPVQPFVWLTGQPLEDDPFRTGSSGALDPPTVSEDLERDGLTVTWRGRAIRLDPPDGESTIDGLLGRSAGAVGRVFLVGLDAEGSAAFRQAVGRG